MNEDLAKEPAVRLLEVLLEQTFRQPRTAAAGPVGQRHRAQPHRAQRHGARWLAAALAVLGLGVVLGVMRLRAAAEPVVAPAQDPEPDAAPWLENTVRVSTYAEFVARIQEAQRVHLQLVRPSADGLSLVPIDGATAALDDREQLRAFLAAVPPSGDNLPGLREPSRFAACLYFELRDGKRVVCFVHFGDQPLFAPQALMPRTLAAGPFLTTLNDLHLQAITKARITSGSTYSLDELQQVPVTTRTITCRPLPPGTVERHLGRFTQLERLELVFQTSLGSGPVAIELPAPIRLAEFAVLGRLRHLRCPGNGTTDADAEALARLPALTSLRIDGGLGDLSTAGLRALVRRLEAIELFDVADPDAVVYAVADAALARRVTVQCRALAPETFTLLLAMPTLADLALGGAWCTDESLQQLAKTKLERLALHNTKVTAAGLTTLASVHTLLELDLRRHPLDAATAKALAEAMPRCRIRRPGEVDESLPIPTSRPGTTRR